MSNPNKKVENQSSIKENMENHIFSMLKGAGVIEGNDNEFYEDLEESNVDYLKEDSLDLENLNRNSNKKGKINRPSLFSNDDLYINHNINFYRNDTRKFTHQPFYQNPLYSMNKTNPIYQITRNNSYNFFLNNPINYNYSFSNERNQNLKMNNNPIPITTTPLGMRMPIRTFNFKTKQNLNDNKFQNTILNIPINDPAARDLESLLIQKGYFTHQIYNKLKGTFISLMKSQQTSRILQYYLDKTPNDVIHLIFSEFSNQVDSLLLDPYANYFCLKIFYFLNFNDRIVFLKKISPILDVLCVNKIATYPIQCIIEQLISDEEKNIIVNSLKKNLMKLCFDVYGAHVIEKLIINFGYEKHLENILNFISENFLFLSNNSNGLCIVKKTIILEYKLKGERFNSLKKILINKALELIQNPYGNYALQTAIDNWNLNDIKEIYPMFYGKCLVFSIQKFSSNVIEKCIQKSEEFTLKFINEICSDENSICILLKNNYGNYVIQTTLKVCDKPKRVILISLIKKNLILINDKKLTNKWRSIISSYVLN
jgi:hypothetical protein